MGGNVQCSAVPVVVLGAAGGCWELAVTAGKASGTLGLSPHGVCLCSWGPDDDGKTVDGPHQLGKVKPSPSSPTGEPPGLVASCLPIQAGRDIAVTLCVSLMPAEVPLSLCGWERWCCGGRTALRQGRRGWIQQEKALSQPAVLH